MVITTFGLPLFCFCMHAIWALKSFSQWQGQRKPEKHHCPAFAGPEMLHCLSAPSNLLKLVQWIQWQLSVVPKQVHASCYNSRHLRLSVQSPGYWSEARFLPFHIYLLLDWRERVTDFQYEIKGRHIIGWNIAFSIVFFSLSICISGNSQCFLTT